MTAERKSRPLVAQETGRTETAAFDGAAVPYEDSITLRGGGQTGIASLLMHGAENAIPGCHLRQLTGLSDRDLRRRIQEERLSGVPILSDNASGYYLPADDLERRQFVRSMRGRAKEIEAVATAVEGAGADWT